MKTINIKPYSDFQVKLLFLNMGNNLKWLCGDALDVNKTKFDYFKNVIYQINENNQIRILKYSMIKNKPIISFNGFYMACKFNKHDTVIQCPTEQNNIDFLVEMEEYFDNNKSLLNLIVEYDVLKASICYKIVNNNLKTYSIGEAKTKNYNIVNYIILKSVMKIKNKSWNDIL